MTTLRLSRAVASGPEIIIDLFAGGGGASQGIFEGLGRHPDVAVNHDPLAVGMHAANHPGTLHLCQDVRSCNPLEAAAGRPVGLLHASPDCTQHSRAKGGRPVRDKQLRELAWTVRDWVEALRPRVLTLENVMEFMWWGPEDAEGHVIKERRGETFRAFVAALRELGYKVQWRMLKACDFGAPTSRERLFMVARRDGRPIRWPEPTHGPGRPRPWRTAAECIDFSLPCYSIFLTPEEVKRIKEEQGLRRLPCRRPLQPKTLARIARGVMRYVVQCADPFLVHVQHGSNPDGTMPVREPLRTITARPTGGGMALVSPFMVKGCHGNTSFRGQDVERPLTTITTEPGFMLAGCYLDKANFLEGGAACASLAEPLDTITTQTNRFNLVAAFLAQHNGGFYDGDGRECRSPLSTITRTGSQQQLVTAHLLREFGQSTGQPAAAPCGTITAGGGGKTKLVASHLVKLQGTCLDGQAVGEPMPTITAGGNHLAEVRAFLMAYYGGDQVLGQDARDPLRTLTAKDRMGLVMVHGEPHLLVDICMRMLEPRELYLAQGFPASYVFERTADGTRLTRGEQVQMVGNSVSPPVEAALVRANCPDLGRARVVEMGEAAGVR